MRPAFLLQSLASVLRRQEPAAGPVAAPTHFTLEQIRQRHLALLDDCSGQQLERVRAQVAVAPAPQALWLLRCDIYQVMARSHSEPEALRRIHELAEAFEGWVPPSVLARAQAVTA